MEITTTDLFDAIRYTDIRVRLDKSLYLEPKRDVFDCRKIIDQYETCHWLLNGLFDYQNLLKYFDVQNFCDPNNSKLKTIQIPEITNNNLKFTTPQNE
ncbi:hypothetical protein COBT_004283, partial [Conglomerata obtusa]